MLKLYVCFHANLSFSSIPPDHYDNIIDECYWPIVDLIGDYGVKFGLEFSGTTLETIAQIDKDFVKKVRTLWHQNKCEVIGSGYSQIIAPLVPSTVNLQNLWHGNQISQYFFNKIPRTAYVNEQAYSAGLIPLYKEAGYHTLLMDWNNSVKWNNFPTEFQYKPLKLQGTNDSEIILVWNHSISFQKFQHFIHGELGFDNYIHYLERQYSNKEIRHFLLYGSDWEILNLRPGDIDITYLPFNKLKDQPELQRLIKLLEWINSNENFSIVTPSEVGSKITDKSPIVRLESAETPIICKKQDKYNITRWALSGRDDVNRNTLCYQVYYRLMRLESLINRHPNSLITANNNFVDQMRSELNDLWKGLLKCWCSDYRTNTTEIKNLDFQKKVGEIYYRLSFVESEFSKQVDIKDDFVLIIPLDEDIKDLNFDFTCQFELGQFFSEIGIKIDGKEVLSQMENVKYYRDGSVRFATFLVQLSFLANDYVCGKFFEKKEKTNLSSANQQMKDRVITSSVDIEFHSQRGGTIKRLKFPNISSATLIGCLEHGFFEDISLSPDWYSGHVILFNQALIKDTDLKTTTIEIPNDLSLYPIRIPVRCKVLMKLGELWKTYHIYTNEPRVDITYHFRFSSLKPYSFRLGILTIFPESFDINTLSFTTINGGKDPERFQLRGKIVKHDEPVSVDVTSESCLGATDGWLKISDKDKSIGMVTHHNISYSVPLIHFEEVSDSYFFRIYNSISECDETNFVTWKGHKKVKYSIVGELAGENRIRQTSKIINQKPIFVGRNKLIQRD